VIDMRGTPTRCPIGGEKIDESAARVNGAINVVILASAIVFQAPWLLAYLLVDYLLKLTVGFAGSPNCWLAHKIANALKLEHEPVDSAPKRFAAIIAVIMLTAGLVLAYGFGSMAGFTAVTVVFAVCAALDAFAGFCLGCYLYGWLPEKVSMRLVRVARKGAATNG
jgi:hypothetical protein